MISFDENSLYRPESNDGNFYFSELYVNNSRVFPNDGTGILENSLPFTRELRLSSSQNNLSIGISVSDYVPYLNEVEYSYMLEGFDSDWIPATSGTLNYTNLPPGKYTLKVRSAGDRTGEEMYGEMSVSISKPLYARWWALLLYSLVAALTGYAVWRSRRNRKEWADTLRKEKEEKSGIEHEGVLLVVNKQRSHLRPVDTLESFFYPIEPLYPHNPDKISYLCGSS